MHITSQKSKQHNEYIIQMLFFNEFKLQIKKKYFQKR